MTAWQGRGVLSRRRRRRPRSEAPSATRGSPAFLRAPAMIPEAIGGGTTGGRTAKTAMRGSWENRKVGRIAAAAGAGTIGVRTAAATTIVAAAAVENRFVLLCQWRGPNLKPRSGRGLPGPQTQTGPRTPRACVPGPRNRPRACVPGPRRRTACACVPGPRRRTAPDGLRRRLRGKLVRGCVPARIAARSAAARIARLAAARHSVFACCRWRAAAAGAAAGAQKLAAGTFVFCFCFCVFVFVCLFSAFSVF